MLGVGMRWGSAWGNLRSCPSKEGISKGLKLLPEVGITPVCVCVSVFV